MKTPYRQVLSDKDTEEMNLSNSDLAFLLTGCIDNRLAFPFQHRDLFQYLSFQVIRTPSKLIFHVQRIYYCFQENLPEQLYASILDLLIVLQRRGNEISRRMFNGAKSKLNRNYRREKLLRDPDLRDSLNTRTHKFISDSSILLQKVPYKDIKNDSLNKNEYISNLDSIFYAQKRSDKESILE